MTFNRGTSWEIQDSNLKFLKKQRIEIELTRKMLTAV